jgi:hypothetical protein
VTRDEALRLAHAALDREGCRVTGEVGAERFFSLRGLWFRSSIGLLVEDAATGDIIGHACVTVSEISRRVVALYIPPRGVRVHDPFWFPPDPLWRRLGLCVVAPLSVIAFVLLFPFFLHRGARPGAHLSSLPFLPAKAVQASSSSVRDVWGEGAVTNMTKADLPS